MNLTRGKILPVVCAALLLNSTARAANDSWTGASSVNWGDSNWSGNNPPVSGDSLIFGPSAASGTTLLDNLMTPGAFSVGSITFAAGAPGFVINPATAGTNGFTLTGAITNNSTNLQTINDIISFSGVNHTISMTPGGGSITLGGNDSGLAGSWIIVQGTGTFALTGINSFTGSSTTLQGLAGNYSVELNTGTGILALGNNNALGAGGFYVNATGTVEALGPSPITIAGPVTENNLNYTIGGTTALTFSGSYAWGGSNVLTVNNTAMTTFSGTTAIRLTSAATRTVNYAGTGNITIGQIVDGTAGANGGIVYQGTGTFDMNGANTYHGTTVASSGVIALDNSANNNASTSFTAITIGSATAATLRVVGNYTIGASGTGSSLTLINTVTGPSLGTITMVGGTNVLNIHSTTANATVLTLNANNTLNFGLGATADEIILASGLKVAPGTNNAINIAGVGNLNGTTQTLISAGATSGSFSVGATSTSGSSVYLASTSGNFNGYVVALTGTTAGSLKLTETLTYTTPATAFWSGTVSSTWNSIINGNANNTNWESAATSGTDVHAPPGATSNVIFSISSGAQNLATNLGASLTTINSLEFDSAAGPSTPVSISGGTLAINASGTNFEGLSGVGITVDSGAGTQVINSAVALGGDQTWLVNNSSSNPFTVNGAVSGAHALTIAGPGAVILAGANSYTGSTTINNGSLFVNGSLNSASNVVVTGSGPSAIALLGGTGTINGTVTIGGLSAQGLNEITGGTPTSIGTLTLANGLTINAGIVYLANPGAISANGNFINISSGNLTANNGAIIEVPSLSTGTYQLIGDSAGIISGTSNFTIETLLGAPAPGNYSLQITSGTLQLVVATATTAQPTLTLGVARVMFNQSGTLSGTVGNVSGGATLNGTLADNSSPQGAGSGTLNVTNFPNSTITVAAGTSALYTAVVGNVGSRLGTNVVNTIVTDGNAAPTTAVATGTINVLGNRVVVATGGGFGSVHEFAVDTASTTLSSTGADNQNTRVTVSDGGLDSGTNGITVGGGSPSGTFNGSFTDIRTLSGSFAGLGPQSGTVTLTTNGEGLTGESPINVSVGYTAQVFSGQASWASSTGGAWTSNTNWGDTNVADLNGAGAPGLSGFASIGDTATFNNVSGQSGVSTVTLGGNTATLAGITFNSSNGYAITSGTIILQGPAAPIVVTTGTGTITAVLTGSGAGVNKSGTGTLILGAVNTFTGSTTISNGIIQTTVANALPAGTFLTLGDLANDSGMLIMAGNQSISGLATIGTGTGNNIVGGTTSVSTLTLNTGVVSSVINTFTGNLGGTGANQNNLALTLTGSGMEVLSGSVTYTGATAISGGVLQTPTMLPTSAITLNGGVWQPLLTGSTNYNFTLGTTAAGNVGSWGSGGGFAAKGGVLVLTANGGGTLVWGNGSFAGNGGAPIVFGSPTSNNQVILTNNINLNTGDAFEQVVIVNGTTPGSSVLLSGSIIPGTGNSGLSKAGPGILYISGANTYTGTTQIANGLLIAENNSFADGVTPGAFGLATNAISIGDAGSSDAQPAPAGANQGLLIAGGNFTIARAINIGNTGNVVNSVTLGGTSNNFETFSGLISTVKNFQVVMVATTGTNALNITNGITASANSDTVTFNNVGTVNVTGTIGNGGGTISLAQIGSGTTYLRGSNNYTGATTINQGNLVAVSSSGTAIGSGPVNLNPTNNTSATLSGNGTVSGTVTVTSGTGLNIAHLAPGVNTSGNFGGIGTLTLKNGLTIGIGSALDFDLGTASDLIAVTGGLTLGTGVVLNINQVAGFGSGTYNLISYTGLLNGDTTGWTVTGIAPATIATFSSGGGFVTVTLTPNPAPANAYWGGAYGGAGTGTWNTFANGGTFNTNWLTAISGGVDPTQIPSGSSNVFFIADSGSNTNTFLGANFTINSLNFTGTDAAVTTGSLVTISGSITGSGTNNSLTILAAGVNGNAAGSGITTGPGAAADIINAPIVLGGNQTWTLNAAPSAPLTVNGTISGAQALTIGGSGALILGGNNTFTGGFGINGSVSVVLNNPGALNSTTPDSLTFGASSTGTLSLNGNSITIGSLSTSTTPGAPVIRNGSATPVTLTIDENISGTYAGVIRDGSGGGALSLIMAGPGMLTLSGSNSYTGVTNVNGGYLQVTNFLASGTVNVNSGTLGGPGGTFSGTVVVNSGGKITPSVGTSSSPGTLTFSNGLTINSGGAAAFNVIDAGANDLISITGDLTYNSGAIIQITPLLTTSGTYALMTYTGATNLTISSGSLVGIGEQTLNGGALASNYSFALNSGTLDLIVATTPLAIADISINSPASGSRVIANTTVTITGSVRNAGTTNSLTGTLADAGGALTVTGLNPNPAMVNASSSVSFTGTINSTGSNLGNNSFGVSVTDGSSLNTSGTATSILDVIANRVVTPGVALSTGTSVGVVHVGTVFSGTLTLSSTGADSQYTRISILNPSGTDAFGVSITGGNPSGTFNGSLSDTRSITGTLSSVGTDSGITLSATTRENGGAGLPGESDNNVFVNIGAQVFSGRASWALPGNGSWAANGNWGDTVAPNIGGIGAPGLSGALSGSDSALFTDVAGQSGTTTISLNGVSPNLLSLVFSSTNTIYNIATGGTTGGSINMQNSGTIAVTTGTGQISANIAGTTPINFNITPGSDLIISSTTITHSGSMNFNSGMTTFSYPGLLGGGTNVDIYTIAAGATLELNASTPQNLISTGGSITITGSGTLLKSGTGVLENHGNGGTINMNLLPGAVIEIANGLFQSGGNATSGTGPGNPASGGGSIVWTNNKASLLLDAGGSIDPWDGANITVDALLGSGTVTRNGFNTGNNVINVGIANGSGTFAGTITNALGNMSINKVGTGLEVLTGSNSYGGFASIQGGTLRVTNSTGLGFGGISFITFAGQHTATASGSSTLDIAGGITINDTLTLNNGSLINSVAGTTSVFDSGIVGIDFGTDNSVGASGTNPITVTITGGSGTGATAIAATQANNQLPIGGNTPASGQNLFTRMTNAGSGYLPGTVPTVVITQGSGTIGGTTTAVISQIILNGATNTIGGAGNLLINGLISGSGGGFTTIGTGTVILTQAEAYTGATGIGAGSTLQLGTGTTGQDGVITNTAGLVDNGLLFYNRVGSYSFGGSISGTGSVVIAGSGTQTFAGINSYTGTTGILAGSTLRLGNGASDGTIVSSTVSNNGTLVFNTAGSQNSPAVITGTGNILMVGSGNQALSGNNTYSGSTIISSGTLQLGSVNALGNTSGITVSSTGALNVSNGITAQTVTLSTSGQTLTLNNGSTLAFGVSNSAADQLVISNGAVLSMTGTTFIDLSLLSGTGGSFTIITDAAGFQGWGPSGSGTFALGPLPALATGTLSQTATSVSISFTGVSTVYWKGSGTSFSGNWSDYTNFTTDQAGTMQLSGSFGATQDLIFSANAAVNQTNGVNFLDTSISAHSLTINDPAGVDIGSIGGNVLTLAGSTGNTGITVSSAAGANSIMAEIDANVLLAGTPNITVNSTAGLLITGIISGSHGLIVNGADMLTLAGPGTPGNYAPSANTFSGTVQLISGTLNVNSDGAFGSGTNVVYFNPGAGNSVTLQSGANGVNTGPNRTFNFASGTAIIDPGSSGNVMTISGTIAGSAPLMVVDTGELVLSGNVTYTGTARVLSGTLKLSLPGTLAQSGTTELNVSPGATLLLSSASPQNISSGSGASIAFTGSGTLQSSGPGTLQMHGRTGQAGAIGSFYIDMSGGNIEVVSGMLENGGPGAPIATIGNPTNGNGSPTWTGTYNGTPFTNLSSMKIDASGTFDVWNGNNVMIDALNGSGVLTRLGFSNTEGGSVFYIGDNNGSGEFDGVITNQFGTLNIVKEGTGTEILTGNNSYSGSTFVTGGGTLKVTSSTGLGNGGADYITNANVAPNASVTVTGSSTLDLNSGGVNGNIVVDKAITLSSGSLINSAAGTTSTIDNGVAAVTLTGSVVTAYTNPTVNVISPGTGSGAAFTGGTSNSPGGNSPFAEVTSSGSGYTVAPTLQYVDQSGSGSGVSATAILSSLSLQGNSSMNFIGGNGNLTINAAISGTSGFTTTGTGTLTLNGSNSYSGPTTVASGNLANNGFITGLVNVAPAAGPAIISGTGAFGSLVTLAAASGSNVSHIAPGVNTNGNFAMAGTLTFKNGLSIGNGSDLDFDLEGTSDLIAVTGALSLGSNVVLNVNPLVGFSPGTYTLITYTGALSGNTSGWTLATLPGDTATFASGGGVVTVTITQVTNDSQLSISPSPVSLGSVLVGATPSGTTASLINTSANGSTGTYAAASSGWATVTPLNGTIVSNGTATLNVGATGPINLTSGNGQVIGTVSATNSSRTSGSAAPVQVTVDVFQAFSGSTSIANFGDNTMLNITNFANTDGANGQRAGITFTGFSVGGNTNFVASIDNGSVGDANQSTGDVTSDIATVSVASNLLNGTYHYNGTVTGTAQYTDPALAMQAGVPNQVWTGVSISATVTGQTSFARTNVYSAQISSGSSYAGYSLSSSVDVNGSQTFPNTGPAGNQTTTATLLDGTASATTTVDMSFDSTPAEGPDNPFRASDILTLTGIHPVGSTLINGLTVTLTDQYVLQITYDVTQTGLEIIAQNTGNGWINAIALNSTQTGTLYANKSYSDYLAGTAGGDTPALGAYGYLDGEAWAVLDHTSVNDPVSEFAVMIPEPGTYAMIIGGFGMLAGFHRLRRRARGGGNGLRKQEDGRD